MDNQEIELEIKKQLGLSLSALPTGTAPLDVPREKDKRKDVGRKKAKNKEPSQKTQLIRPVEKKADLWIREEAKLELEREKKGDEFKPSDEARKYLEGKYLFPLKEKSVKFPRARWFCRLCEYHCDNMLKCLEHISEPRHQRLTRVKELDHTLNNLPSPTKHHKESLNILLAEIERDQGLSDDDLKTRQAVADAVHSLLEPSLAGCTVRLYGSSLTGLGLKVSDVNLDLQITEHHKPHLTLIKALEILRNCSDFHSVTDEFTSKIPSIKFCTISNLQCELSLNNLHASQTSLLLRDYSRLDRRVRTLGVAFRYWARLVRLDRQAEGTLPSHSFAILVVYFLQQQACPVVPCIHSYLDTKEETSVYTTPDQMASWKSENQMTTAELWIDLFVFLSMRFKSSENVVSIKKSGLLSNEEKQWKSKKLAIEDPFSSKRSLCRSIQSLSVYDYITDCLKTGYLYFGTIQTKKGPVIRRIVPEEEGPEQDELPQDITLESWLEKKGRILTKADAERGTDLVARNMIQFSFDSAVLTNNTVLAAQCVGCGQEGHLASSCPEEMLPTLSDLPPLPKPYQGMLSEIITMVQRDFAPLEPELRERNKILYELSNHIHWFWPHAQLSLFGSSNNGFAFRQSDLDISLTFKNVSDSSKLDSILLIEELGEKLKRLAGVRGVLAITSAKVPIVKMYHLRSGLDADISLYNILAQENTNMLASYANLDERCRTLGYMVKLFAKICDIGDASRGSLSSYAYILMMIFYLQKVSPPVLPVLQEMYDGEESPQNMVDGWNAWYCQDKERLRKWTTENKSSIGQLWVGFLDFFARSWDDKKLVVSIRQSQDLTKFEKMWISPCIAIEDPFELSHNLGAGISRKMNLYIKKAFIKARQVFGTPVRPQGLRQMQDHFFDKTKLTDGAPPNDRGCRACGKIGHLVADCPRKKASDNRKRENREHRERLKSETDGRERTRSEVSDKTGAVPVTFASTDIRFRKIDGTQEGSNVKPLSQKELVRAEKKEIKRLERKRKKQGKLSKEENVALDSFYSQRKKNKSGPEVSDKENIEVPSNNEEDVIRDDFDENFDYNTIKPVSVKVGEILDYLDFNFEEVIKARVKKQDIIAEKEKVVKARVKEQNLIAAPDEDFDYNDIQADYKTEGFIDYFAPVSKPNTGARPKEPITIESSSGSEEESETVKVNKKKAKEKKKQKITIVKVASKSYEMKKTGISGKSKLPK